MTGPKKSFIGVDLGGTKLDVALVNEEGAIEKREKIATNVAGGADIIINDIVDIVRVLVNEASVDPKGIGVGIAGQINSENGIVDFAPNLKWRNYPLQDALHQKLQLPVFVTNDVRAAAWGEWLYGVGRGAANVVCVFIGTGIGSGIVVNGRMLNGATNCAGEIGHTIVDLEGPPCHCGSYGCLEAISGGWAIARRAKELIQEDPVKCSLMLKYAENRIDLVTAKIVSQAAAEGDPMANALLEEVVRALIAGVINIAHTLNPECVILGGGVIEGNPSFIPRIKEGLKKRALKLAAQSLEIVKAELKNDAGVIGAAAYARSSREWE